MGFSLPTEIEVTTKGTVAAAQQFRDLANESRKLGESAEGGGLGFTHLARAFGQMGGANREAFMVIRGLTEATEVAQGSWKKFASAIGDTAVFAGAAIGIAMVIEEAKKLSDETNKLWETAGGKEQSVMGNWLIGMGLGYEKTDTGIVKDSEREERIRQNRDAQARRNIKDAQRTLSPEDRATDETAAYARDHQMNDASRTALYLQNLQKEKSIEEDIKRVKQEQEEAVRDQNSATDAQVKKEQKIYESSVKVREEMKARREEAKAMGKTDLAADMFAQLDKSGWGKLAGYGAQIKKKIVEGLAGSAEETTKSMMEFESRPHYQSAALQGSTEDYQARIQSAYSPANAQQKIADYAKQQTEYLRTLVQKATGVTILSLTGAS